MYDFQMPQDVFNRCLKCTFRDESISKLRAAIKLTIKYQTLNPKLSNNGFLCNLPVATFTCDISEPASSAKVNATVKLPVISFVLILLFCSLCFNISYSVFFMWELCAAASSHRANVSFEGRLTSMSDLIDGWKRAAFIF